MAWIEERKRQHHTAYKVYWRDPAGKVRTRTFTRSADAKRYAREVEHRKDTGSYVDPAAGNVTLAEAFDHMMVTATHLRPSTRELYAMHGRLYLAGGSLGDRPIRTIGKADVRTFLAELAATKGTARSMPSSGSCTGRSRSPSRRIGSPATPLTASVSRRRRDGTRGSCPIRRSVGSRTRFPHGSGHSCGRWPWPACGSGRLPHSA
jgi:hypothetical protein